MGMAIGTQRPVTDINVTPLIDVVLVLLIIFMVMTPLAEKQMFTRVPEFEPNMAPIPPDQVPPDQTVLTVRKDGRVWLNKQDMAVEEAMERLRGAYEGRLSKVLFFNAEDTVSYDLVVKVLDLCHQAGVNTIGMMTDPPLRVQPEGAAPAEGAPAPAPQ